jgi:phospholipid/cholesterol/gamma-HCH transport system ATP-binding protein
VSVEGVVEAQADQSALAVRGLKKSFGEQHVLAGVDLDVAQGDTLVILGRSGTGKSVLLKLIIGLQKPDAGSIRIHSEEVTKLDDAQLNAVRKKVGFLFQDGALYDSLSIEDNVAFSLERHTKMPAAERRDKVRQLLSQVGMDKDASKMPSEISGGMKKRVGLARALALEPDILLFDEPTAGLDPITAKEIEDLMRKLQKERKTASIVVTHDLRGAKTVADRVALIRDGCFVMQGTFEELEKSDEPFVREFMRNGQ